MFKKVLAPCLLSFALISGNLQAQNQNLFVLPGAASTGQNVLVYTPTPLVSLTNFNAGPGAFRVYAKPDGSKFYVIANSGSQTVTEIGSDFATAKSLGNPGSQAGNAVMSLDGRRLAVAAGGLHIYDTTTDLDILPNGITSAPGVNYFDVTITLDGTRFIALGTNPAGGSLLTSIDTSNNVVAGSLPIQGLATGVSVSPNDLIYVSTQNEILEINPATLQVTPGGTISVNARPSRVAFTPDGKYGIVANGTPITGSSVLLLDLSSRVVTATIPNFGVVLDRFIALGVNSFLAYSSQNQSLYQITISSSTTSGIGLNISPFSLPGISTTNVTAAIVSDEVPLAGRVTPQFLFVVASGILYRYDLTAGAITAQSTLTVPNAELSYAGPVSTNAQTSNLLQFGLGQTVMPGGVSNPIVVQAVDQTGRPLSGATVTFATNNAGATLSNTTVVTGSNGYATTTLTAPAGSGQIIVTATSNSQSIAYNISVGNGTGATSGGLTIVAGQGQLLFENFNTGISGFGSPLVVMATDVNGKPAAGVPVTFTVSQGIGSVIGGVPSGQPNSVIVTSDTSGLASVGFLSSTIPSNGTGFAQSVVVASAPSTNSLNFYLTTTPQQSPPLVQLLSPEQGATISAPAGTTLPAGVVAQVTSVLGQPIPNVSVRLDNTGNDPTQVPTITCQDTSGNGTGVLTDATGIGSCNVMFNGKIGFGSTTASVGYFQNTRTIKYQVTVGLPGVIQILQGNNQSGTPGQKLPLALVVQVSDSFGNILPFTNVNFTVVQPGTVTLSNIVSMTDASGKASATATLGNIAGAAQVRVSAGSAAAVFNLVTNIPSTGIQPVSGDLQTALVGTQFGAPVVVRVVNSAGVGVGGIPVTFTVTSNNATLGTPNATTANDGTAFTTVTAGPNAGTINIVATSTNFTTSFTLTSRLPGPTNLVFLNGASFELNKVSPGAIITIGGSGIATGVSGLVEANNIVGPQPTSLAGVSVSFNGIAAPIYYVCNGTCSVANTNAKEFVTVQVPFEISPGNATVVINAAGGGTASTNVNVQPYGPGIFETLYGNQKLAVAVRPDGSYVSPSNPARRGETVQIFATGLGPVSPTAVTGRVGLPNQNVTSKVVTGLNNGGVPYQSVQYAPDMVGVYIVNLQIPTDTQTGPAQPIGLILYDGSNNPYFAQSTFIPIQ